jgi:O-acetyl-ADP-ribose deacetylase (regulator of RNase III)
MARAARIAVRETKNFLERNQSFEKVILVCFGAGALKIYKAAMRKINSWPEWSIQAFEHQKDV